jgi:hypothetical protein
MALIDKTTIDIGPGQKNKKLSVTKSDYYYGTNSGTDIKVVVHLPRVDTTGMRAEIAELEADYQTALAHARVTNDFLEVYGANETTIKNRADAVSALDITGNQLGSAKQKLEDVTTLPTTKTLAEAQTVSMSIFREKAPVRTLGSVYPRSYTRGSRTISGTMIFTIFHQHVLTEILNLNLQYKSTGVTDEDQFKYTSTLPDQLPPLDISLLFANEYGALSVMTIYGLEFFQEGSTFSVHDLYSENVMQWVARDIDPMRVLSESRLNLDELKNSQMGSQLTASSLLYQQTNRNRNQFI